MNTNTSIHVAPDVPLSAKLVKHPAYWVLTIAQEAQFLDIYIESQYQLNKIRDAISAASVVLQAAK